MTVSESFPQMLTALNRVLPAEVKATLRPPAAPQDLAALGSFSQASWAVPGDLLTLLQWHDGQEWNAQLSKKDNRRLLSIPEIIDQLSFFADPGSDFMAPWANSWIPILTNDSGDFLVLETAGEQQGALLHYWHDEPSRSVKFRSLSEWAERLLQEYARTDA
jgi:cell wall assembly regulator SMI1